jgi:hypothetical protein
MRFIEECAMSSNSRRSWLRWLLLCAGGGALPGCGTIFYPERRGQPAGRLDWKVVAFDAIGLVLFFVPGVIAFAVDFATGAIYLPPDHYGKGERTSSKRQELTKRQLPRGRADRQHIEQAVSAHVGRDVVLDDGVIETQHLENIEQFWTVHDELTQSRIRRAA